MDFIVEFAGGRTVAGEKACHVAILAAIDVIERRVNRISVNQAQHWAKYLGLSDGPGRVDISQRRRTHEAAAFVAWKERLA